MTSAKGKRAKFRVGQVVMVIDDGSFLGMKYPVKLAKRTGTHPDGPAWFDTLHNVELERRMRPLTSREISPRRTWRKGKP